MRLKELDLEIPFELDGIISYFTTRKPTEQELQESAWVEVTSEIEWDPKSQDFADEERRLHAVSSLTRPPLKQINNNNDFNVQRAEHFSRPRQLSAISIADDGNLYERLLQHNKLADSLAGDNEDGFTAYKHENENDKENRAVYCCERAAHAVVGTCCQSCLNPTTRKLGALNTTQQKSVVTAADLAKKWSIGERLAERTLGVTTQRGLRKVQHPVQRRFNTAKPHLRYPSLPGKWYSDTAFFTCKSVRGNTCAQVTTNGKGYSRFWPMESKRLANDGLLDMIHNVGIPHKLVTDRAAEEGVGNLGKHTPWRDTVRTYHIHQTTTEPGSGWQNRAEAEIREIKRGIRKWTKRKNSPRRLWCFLGDLVCKQRSLTALDIPSMSGRTGFESVHGWTPDISPFVQFEWWDWVYYLDEQGEQQMARWVGHAENVGGGDVYWLIPISCIPIVTSTVWPMPEEDRSNNDIKTKTEEFMTTVKDRLGDAYSVGNEKNILRPDLSEIGNIFDEDDPAVSPFEPEKAAKEADEETPETYDQFLNAEVLLPRDGQLYAGTVKRRAVNDDGRPTGTRNTNPLLDTREYEVQFPDGATDIYTANLIAENLYSQVDQEGRTYALINEITDHRKDEKLAVPLEDGFTVDSKGNKRPKRTTRGWEFLVSWRDGTADWIPLAELKESFPVEVADYVQGNNLTSQPAFAWWVPFVIRKRARILSKVKSKYWKRTSKYGTRLPHSVKEALKIDEETGTDYWQRAIEKEMKNVRVAFEFNDEDQVPVGHTEIRCHMVFDIKIDLTRKARLVANGHEMEQPKDMTFSSVVSRESVRLFFLLAALNDLDVLSGDIQNAYLTAPITEKLWYRAGLEFGSDAGRPCKVIRALYGIASSGKHFRSYMAQHLREMGFTSCKADPDVWMRAATKTTGEKYWEYVLCYVDDILVGGEKPQVIMDGIAKKFTWKPGSVQPPEIYLGADVKKWYITDSDEPDKARWAMSSTNYTKKAIAEVERELKLVGKQLPKKVVTPLANGYRPEIDSTRELDAERMTYYQGLIGVLRWICELGRLDILPAVSMLSRYLVSAREGHMEQLFHIFAYLKSHDRSTMVFDDTEPSFDEGRFAQYDWSEFYPDAKEAIPTDMPEARGKPVIMSCFLDADHAGCRATRRSHSGIIIFVNRSPITWYSKRQNTVESSTFGSEFCAMKTGVEMVEGLRYKLRMMGVPIDGATNVFCDNKSVVTNSTLPESTLKKKHNAIAYHRTREAISSRTIRVAHEKGATNLADILTKLLPGPRLRELISHILW